MATQEPIPILWLQIPDFLWGKYHPYRLVLGGLPTQGQARGPSFVSDFPPGYDLAVEGCSCFVLVVAPESSSLDSWLCFRESGPPHPSNAGAFLLK